MSYSFKIDIQSYWHPGTGRGRGTDVDAVSHRNAKGLPVLPGRTVKGLLRDALRCWESFTKPDTLMTEQLFGADPEAETKTFGLLRFSDAELAEDVRYFLENDEKLVTGLYRNLYTTAIEYETGTALDKSLRGMEVIVPVTLFAQVEEVPGVAPIEGWDKVLEDALPLIGAVGAHRNRGLGRAVVTLEGR